MSRDAIGVRVNVSWNDGPLKGIREDFDRVGPKIGRKIFRAALRAVGRMWKGEVQGRVPVASGALRDSIVAKISTRKGKGGTATGTVTVGPSSTAARTDGRESVGPGVYGQWVEFGLKKKHYPDQPFLRPTFDSTSDRAIEMFAEHLRNDLADALGDASDGADGDTDETL